jgi:integrase
MRLPASLGIKDERRELICSPGERRRERVITPAEEEQYISAAAPLLSFVATVLLDTGMRPDECFRLGWEEITWINGRNGSLLVRPGKPAAARRVLPRTPRVRAVLEEQWERSGRPGRAGYGRHRLLKAASTTSASGSNTSRLCASLECTLSYFTAFATPSSPGSAPPAATHGRWPELQATAR